ncbi:LysR family transcriptional regulator [Roseomonas sp. HJA6]|uniref:LysR family transcriptional regulator n=1 Tax=Roseomonas alba TaxID=2846776 RepID=A0ABS7A8A3_9PROT|nr:LysR family transcriptional regulator [Neoroseomonas alba]MBW6397399.1 LysR family transcriptional regulator [Neoroseomonas alba]
MYELRDLRMVLAIHEHGSLARAARVLGVAQPALTRQLASLERRVRGRLFERGKRGTVPTDLGRTVIDQAEDIVERVALLNRRTAEVRGDQVRDLAIAAGAYLAETPCLVAASRMVPLQPRVRTRVVSTNWSEVPRMVMEREATLGLCDVRNMRDEPGLEVERLRPHPGFFAVRPGHPLLGQPEIGLADILAYPIAFIGNVPTAQRAPMAEGRTQAREKGWIHPAFPAIIEESPTAALATLAHSDIVSTVTLPIAATALRAGQVAILPWRAPWMSLHPCILRLRNRPLGEAETVFLELTREVDRECEETEARWCAEHGFSPDCV